jgi:hypothetical protein
MYGHTSSFFKENYGELLFSFFFKYKFISKNSPLWEIQEIDDISSIYWII